jgi:uncharacterized protein (TIGR02391 family)
MVKWKYIAKRLADEFQRPTDYGNWEWNYEHIGRTWNSLFEFPIVDHPDIENMSGDYAFFYKLFLTLGEHPKWKDHEKVKAIYDFLEDLKDKGFNRTLVSAIFEKGGFQPADLQVSIGSTGLGSFKFHPEVVKHCQKLLTQGHYANCVNEACKAYNNAVQLKSGNDKDGQDLMFTVWGENGNLRFNQYKTESEINEHEGVKFISGGLMRGLRNPTAHTPAITTGTTFQECVEVLSTTSYLFGKLDKATKIAP